MSVAGRFAPSKGERVAAKALTDLTGTESAPYGPIVDLIVEAIRTGKRVSFIYRKRGSAVCEARTILPREFRRVARPSTGSSTLCVVGFCEKRGADRTLAVELMSDVRMVGSSGPSGYKQG